MQAADKGGLRGVHGPVASLMTTQEQYTVAIEIALGRRPAEHRGGHGQDDAKAAIGYLKQRDGGRATFLPLDAVRGESCGRAASRRSTASWALPRSWCSMNSATTACSRTCWGARWWWRIWTAASPWPGSTSNRFRIVTLDGQVINRGGSMTGGSVSRSAGVLSRANELQRLAGQLEQLRGQLADADRRAQETGRELQKAQYELDVAKEQQRAAAQQVLTLEGAAGTP